MTTTRRAVLYGRVSKLAAGTTEGKSVDQQLHELRAMAERDQVEVVAVHRDDGISASRHAGRKIREGWLHVMAAINDGSCTELWVWEISRATRDRPVWAQLVNACLLQNVKITVAGRVHDPADPDDGFMLDLTAALAVRESAVTSKRIKRDVRAAAAQGLPHGRIPFGYRRVYDDTSGALLRQEPDPVYAPVIAEIFRRTVAEHAAYTIAQDLDTRGIPSPHEARVARLGQPVDDPYPWTLEQVLRIVRNPTYAGLRAHNEGGLKPGARATIVGEAAWDGIVDRETWEHAQLIVERPARRTTSDLSVKHLLSGIAVCGVCGSGCRLIKNRGYPSYACWGGPNRRGTCCVTRSQLPVDTLVAETLILWAVQPDIVERLAAAQNDDDATLAAREVGELQRQLDDLAELVIARKMTPALAGRVEARLLPQLDAARRRAVPQDVAPEVMRFVGPNARRVWTDDLTVPERRRIVRALVTVAIQRSPYSNGVRGFDPDLIDIDWIDPNLAPSA